MSSNAVPFDPAEFVSNLVAAALESQAVADAQAAALRQASVTVREGIVELTVLPSGELGGIVFLEEPSSVSAPRLSGDVMQAYRRGCDEANLATAASVADEGIRAEIAGSVPDDMRERRREDRVEVPAGPETVEAQGPFTVEDLPPDPGFDRVLEVLDADDPMAALQELEWQGGIDLVGVDRPAAEIDRQIKAELMAFSERAEQVGPELRGLRESIETAEAQITVNAWGLIERIEIRPAGLSLEGRQLTERLLQAYSEVTAMAARKAQALLREAGVEDPDDPVTASIVRKAESA